MWSQSQFFSYFIYFFHTTVSWKSNYETWSLNGLNTLQGWNTTNSTLDRSSNPSEVQKCSFRAEGPVSKHNNGDSLNRNDSHVFLLKVAWSIVYTEKRETHWVQLLWNIWTSQSLTHLRCCSRQPSPAAAVLHHAVPLNTQQGQFAVMMAISVWICGVLSNLLHLQHILAVMKLKFIQEYLYPLLQLLS